MNDYNEKKEKKGGFGSLLSGLLRGGGSAAGSGFGSAGGAAGGLGGLFATKAGLLGLVLGGATIAAGVGVVYNFVGPSSKPAYSPELFQNSYYEEESNKAGAERAQARNTAAAASSTLDMFRDQAKKEGIGLGGESADGQPPEAQASGAAASASADAAAPAAPGADGAGMGGGPKLQAGAGFGSKGGGAGGGSAMPRMSGGGAGLSGGIGGQFQSVYRPPATANGGKMSGMTASAAARVKNSPKYAVPNFNKKGAFGQAKFANNMGAKARYSSDVGARGQSGIPFDSSQNVGTGDVGAPNAGMGLGGAGVASGSKLKGSDPSLNNSQVTPPKVPDPVNVSPWKKWTDRAMYAMLAAAVLILITNMLAKFAKGVPWMYMAAMVTAYAAMAAAALVIVSGMMLMTKYGQKYAGLMYVVAGAMLMYQAYQALCGVGEAATKSGADLGAMGKGCPGYNSGQAFGNNYAAAGGDASKMTGFTETANGTTSITPPEGATSMGNGQYAISGVDGAPGNVVGANGPVPNSSVVNGNVSIAGTPQGTIAPNGTYTAAPAPAPAVTASGVAPAVTAPAAPPTQVVINAAPGSVATTTGGGTILPE
ncbi:MAG: hypothetical protein HY952_01745 [Elusimicrobia bacterium]|nr:hypothetical protein [Elusimicrobiota bacterium]